MKNKRKIISLLLSIAMLVTLVAVPTTSFAYENDANVIEYEVTGGYIYFDKSTGTIVDSDRDITAATIPEKIAGKTVTSIGESAFIVRESLKSVTIPGTVKYIADGAFDSCYSLTSVTLNKGLTSIGKEAFAGCDSLKSVTIPGTVKKIGSYAFEACRSLTSITINKGVTDIGDFTFSYCPFKKITIPNSVKNIGIGAFSESGLTNVTIPSSVMSMDTGAFIMCFSLQTITVQSGNKQCSSKDGVLFNAKKTKVLAYPAGSKRTTYTIPKGNKCIGSDAFCYAKNLKEIKIPDSVTSIERGAFLCNGLVEVTIPRSVTSIGEDAFFACPLKKITVQSGNKQFCSKGGVLFNAKKTRLIAYPVGAKKTSYTVPNSVTRIESEAFMNCKYLKHLTIPQSVTKIDGPYFAEFEGTVYSYENSYVQKQAKKYGIKFVPLQKISGKSSFKKTYGNKAFSLKAKAKGKLTYKSSNKKVATVSSKGKVTIKGTGIAKITVTAAKAGKYAKTTKVVTVTVKPKKVTSLKVTKGRKKMTVRWKKDTRATGYQIVYAQNSKFTKGKKTITLKKNTTVKQTIRKLKSKKTYYVKVRAYKKVGSTKIYGSYSKVRKVKVR